MLKPTNNIAIGYCNFKRLKDGGKKFVDRKVMLKKKKKKQSKEI